jgi:retron-type reverse transcriptase
MAGLGLEPIYERDFAAQSYGFRPDPSVSVCLADANETPG